MLRIEYSGDTCHVMNLGDRREAIFLQNDDRQLFLATQAEACTKTGWRGRALRPSPEKRELRLVVHGQPG